MKVTRNKILALIKPYTTRKDVLNAIFREINIALVNKQTVLITSFGTFKVVKSKVKWGQQFHTNERIRLKPVYKIKFYPSRVIEKIVNERNLIEE